MNEQSKQEFRDRVREDIKAVNGGDATKEVPMNQYRAVVRAEIKMLSKNPTKDLVQVKVGERSVWLPNLDTLPSHFGFGLPFRVQKPDRKYYDVDSNGVMTAFRDVEGRPIEVGKVEFEPSKPEGSFYKFENGVSIPYYKYGNFKSTQFRGVLTFTDKFGNSFDRVVYEKLQKTIRADRGRWKAEFSDYLKQIGVVWNREGGVATNPGASYIQMPRERGGEALLLDPETLDIAADQRDETVRGLLIFRCSEQPVVEAVLEPEVEPVDDEPIDL